jgi:excisionase family DNA binding protein
MKIEGTTGKAELLRPQLAVTSGQQFEPLLSVEQASQLLGGMHPKTLMRMARASQLPAIKLGRFWYFRATSLNRWVELSSTRPSVPCQKEFS